MKAFLRDRESELVRKAVKGDRNAMRKIFDIHAHFLATAVRRYLGNTPDSDDVLQEAFIRIFSSLSNFEYRGEGSLRAWMRRICVNEALSTLRRRSPMQELPSETELENLADSIPDEDPNPEGLSPELLMEFLSKLPPGYRTVLNLYVFEQRSHKEIATLLDISENTSYSQYHRAKRLLANMITQYKKDNGLER